MQANEVQQTAHFPLAGLDTSAAWSKQPARPTFQGQYARTTAQAVNVRGFDNQGIFRGGSRTGTTRYIPARVAGSTVFIVQELTTITGKTYVEGSMQYSQAGRVVTLVAVSQGVVKTANAGATSWTTPTNNTGNTPALNYSGLIFSDSNQQKLYFADGSNWVYYSPSTNSVETWTASAGTLPVDSSGNKPRLICTWRGRTVLSGLLLDPQNWFMSRQDNPRDWDYGGGIANDVQTAVAGNASQTLGKIGDVVTALMPATDDILLVGGDHTIFAFRGDPADGGRIDCITQSIGVAWGQAWCQDPEGNIYFMSNKMGVYVMPPGGQPQRISQPIDSNLYAIDVGKCSIRLQWNDRWQGCHVWVTPVASAQAAQHWFYESRSGAWWPDVFGNNNHNPLCCTTFDGNLPSDRACLIGSWDGYVRYLDGDAQTDDGTPIESEVVIGPFLTDSMDTVMVKDGQAILDIASSDVDYEILAGQTAQEALTSEPAESGTWQAGFNELSPVRIAEHAVYVKMNATGPWAFEQLRLRLAGTGKVRARTK